VDTSGAGVEACEGVDVVGSIEVGAFEGSDVVGALKGRAGVHVTSAGVVLQEVQADSHSPHVPCCVKSHFVVAEMGLTGGD
jgi:hypothetical protein